MDDMKFPFDDNLDSEEKLEPSWFEKNSGRIIALVILLFLGAFILM